MEILLLQAKLKLATTMLLAMLAILHPAPKTEIHFGAAKPVQTISEYIFRKGGTEYSKPCKQTKNTYCYGYTINHGTWSEENLTYGKDEADAKANFQKYEVK